MKLSDKLKKENIILSLKSQDKSSVIQELLNRLLDLNFLSATVKLHTFIDKKDKLVNSAVGRGIAFHYSTSIEIDEQLAVLGVSQNGVNYDAPDGQPVHFILLILDTNEQCDLHRKLITRFQHFINDVNFRSQIIDCTSEKEIMDLVVLWEEKHLLNEDF